jgi:hypothetical protein
MCNSIQIAENFQFHDEDRGRHPAPLLAGMPWISVGTSPAKNPDSRELAWEGAKKYLLFLRHVVSCLSQ